MMENYGSIDIQEIPLGVPVFRRRVTDFLGKNGLQLEDLDLYLAVLDPDGVILAGAGLSGDIVKCVAVSQDRRGDGLAAPLLSRLLSIASAKGIDDLKVFTKPGNRSVFESLGFHVIASAPKAILMENGRGLESYLASLSGLRLPGTAGAAVVNADPFTLGHRYLLEKAAAQVDNLYVIPVAEDASRFPASERAEMIRSGSAGIARVVPGGAYQISAATFPSYFLKDLTDVSESQMRLDLDIFARHIAPTLGVSVRFVGSEPQDPLTARYNALMHELLPQHGIKVVEIPRLADAHGPVSASRVRKALDAGTFPGGLVPPSTWKYIVADLVSRAMTMELDAPLKPGLVDREQSGSHHDMDHGMMASSIKVIRSSFIRHFDLEPVPLGKAVEADVLAATGGVNTYRGAIFSQLIVSKAFLTLLADGAGDVRSELPAAIASIAAEVPASGSTHGGAAVRDHGVKGALAMARDGYSELFSSWLPFWRSVRGNEYSLNKTLLLIMSTLDDTCIIHRAGMERAAQVKRQASSLLAGFSEEGIRGMCADFVREGLSPGGAADMLALTLLVDSLLPEPGRTEQTTT